MEQMQFQMSAQIARLREVQWTIVALIGLLAAMYSTMFSQRARVAEGSAARTTPIGSLACLFVNEWVDGWMGGRGQWN